MKNRAKYAVLGLCIEFGGLTATIPASADVFWNLKAEEQNPSLNLNPQMCMGISGGDPGGHVKVGTPIIVWDCNPSNDQVWNQIPLAGGNEIVDEATDPSGNSVCLYDKGGVNDRGTQLTVADCNGNYSERFDFLPVTQDAQGYMCYRIQSAVSGRYVGVANASANPVKDGMSVIMWDPTGSDDQVWCQHPDPVIHIS